MSRRVMESMLANTELKWRYQNLYFTALTLIHYPDSGDLGSFADNESAVFWGFCCRCLCMLVLSCLAWKLWSANSCCAYSRLWRWSSTEHAKPQNFHFFFYPSSSSSTRSLEQICWTKRTIAFDIRFIGKCVLWVLFVQNLLPLHVSLKQREAYSSLFYKIDGYLFFIRNRLSVSGKLWVIFPSRIATLFTENVIFHPKSAF